MRTIMITRYSFLYLGLLCLINVGTGFAMDFPYPGTLCNSTVTSSDRTSLRTVRLSTFLFCTHMLMPKSAASPVASCAAAFEGRNSIKEEHVAGGPNLKGHKHAYSRETAHWERASKEAQSSEEEIPDFNVWYNDACVELASIANSYQEHGGLDAETRMQLDSMYDALKPIIAAWQSCAQVVHTRAWFHLNKKYATLASAYRDPRTSIKKYAHAMLSCIRVLVDLVVLDTAGLLVDQCGRREVDHVVVSSRRGRSSKNTCRRDMQEEIQEALRGDGDDDDDYEFLEDGSEDEEVTPRADMKNIMRSLTAMHYISGKEADCGDDEDGA